jgi:hypothetical protein
MGGANALLLSGVVTDIAIDPVDASDDSIYITFGGIGDYRHVWHFNGGQWQQRSGPAAGAMTSVLDVQHTLSCATRRIPERSTWVRTSASGVRPTAVPRGARSRPGFLTPQYST